jgi:hypothetical protein
MAVKVMWARALRPQDDEVKSGSGATATPVPLVAAKRGPEKVKRRRSSVFDGEGNEVFITLVCLKCHKTRPLSQFGLRRMADGAIRNQPWCRPCRSDATPRKARAGGSAPEGATAAEDPSISEGSRRGASPAVAPDAGLLAAAVAAALHRGRG